ncbi:MAG: hypothetical protein IIY21_07590 [Clostridiales bacterium]|nr:hypothetical protein [Clostridiales bacterium]MBQ1572512.1 hypothetical protein [Clostridiales bacterium]
MKKTYTLDEIRKVAFGAYCTGYCDAYEPDDDFDMNNTDEIDFLIEKYIDVGSENEGRICILS